MKLWLFKSFGHFDLALSSSQVQLCCTDAFKLERGKSEVALRKFRFAKVLRCDDIIITHKELTLALEIFLAQRLLQRVGLLSISSCF